MGNPSYCWGVVCKNERAHHQTNLMAGHKILLAETDPFEPLPVSGPFQVVCDDCGEEHTYEPTDVVRLEQQPPKTSRRTRVFDESGVRRYVWSKR